MKLHRPDAAAPGSAIPATAFDVLALDENPCGRSSASSAVRHPTCSDAGSSAKSGFAVSITSTPRPVLPLHRRPHAPGPMMRDELQAVANSPAPAAPISRIAGIGRRCVASYTEHGPPERTICHGFCRSNSPRSSLCTAEPRSEHSARGCDARSIEHSASRIRITIDGVGTSQCAGINFAVRKCPEPFAEGSWRRKACPPGRRVPTAPQRHHPCHLKKIRRHQIQAPSLPPTTRTVTRHAQPLEGSGSRRENIASTIRRQLHNAHTYDLHQLAPQRPQRKLRTRLFAIPRPSSTAQQWRDGTKSSL